MTQGCVMSLWSSNAFLFALHNSFIDAVWLEWFFLWQTYLTLVVPESAVASYYVCFAQEPGTLRKNDEPFWQYMNEQKAKLDQEIE